MLFKPFKLGPLELDNRIVMAPMTRSRAVAGNVPSPLAALYYAQRAGAGLLIAEGAQVSPQGVGYIRTPGIHSNEQVAGWKKVTAAVHAAGGKIALQLWHVGRCSHPEFQDGALPVAPSAIAPPEGQVYTSKGFQPIPVPRALELDEMPGIVEQFRQAAVNAKIAGFDGVELHGAHGYLLDQFLRTSSNTRTDSYGGSIEKRARLPLEIAEAVVSVWGGNRVGYKISPWTKGLWSSPADTVATYVYLTEALNGLKVAYLELLERHGDWAEDHRLALILRRKFDGAIMLGGGYTAESGEEALHRGEADLIAYAKLFIANPDLPERFRRGGPFNTPDAATTYQGMDERGYTDYPRLVPEISQPSRRLP
jgi:N-ethylmaleimide reductase